MGVNKKEGREKWKKVKDGKERPTGHEQEYNYIIQTGWIYLQGVMLSRPVNMLSVNKIKVTQKWTNYSILNLF